MNVKLDKADKLFSEYIRRRDGKCVRCQKKGSGKSGIVGLQNSHYFGRSRENTRFDERNCDALCFGCHRYWGSDDKEGYRNFKLKQLGKRQFTNLEYDAHLYKKRDRKLAALYWAKRLKELL